MFHCLTSLRDLVAAWWMTDRVRISPSTGRLLGLRPGDRFVFRCESFLIVGKAIRETAMGHELVYQVESSLGDGCLVVVRNGTTHAITGEFNVPTLKLAVFDSDLVVVSKTTKKSCQSQRKQRRLAV